MIKTKRFSGLERYLRKVRTIQKELIQSCDQCGLSRKAACPLKWKKWWKGLISYSPRIVFADTGKIKIELSDKLNNNMSCVNLLKSSGLNFKITLSI